MQNNPKQKAPSGQVRVKLQNKGKKQNGKRKGGVLRDFLGRGGNDMWACKAKRGKARGETVKRKTKRLTNAFFWKKEKKEATKAKLQGQRRRKFRNRGKRGGSRRKGKKRKKKINPGKKRV